MRKKTISFELQVFETMDELGPEDKKLLQSAIEARKNAYAPYSKFNVGAAVLLQNDVVVIGNNQENASYPSGLCAERVAVFQAGAKYPGIAIKSIAITAMSENHMVDSPAAPCGNCRQAISEYEFRQKEPISILMMGEKGEVIKCNSLSDILPLGFNNTYL
ncbi:cytidine deaminase [Maribacter polysiphoniae]|uniref:Cytidine deaminase n=1 Tax=Maribacter polysiphoniae TaxID=429344 RepID=A0A316DVZ8_9FLAO|nr:cytidine deaminase [Maribacter polysiphoniae]MBD1261935.1 cytidine deaminase [Maribacter polysiphoniae]PWK22301.1 cytidine deaminase [Maribacter polysiphoniae]